MKFNNNGFKVNFGFRKIKLKLISELACVNPVL